MINQALAPLVVAEVVALPAAVVPAAVAVVVGDVAAAINDAGHIDLSIIFILLT